MAKAKSVYRCSECGAEFAKWQGKCDTCGEWNTLVEEPIAVVKRGRKGATILARDGKRALRFEVATTPIRAADTTGAGDAFSAGFLHGWLDGRRKGLAASAALQRGAVAGNRAALRHLSNPPGELQLG